MHVANPAAIGVPTDLDLLTVELRRIARPTDSSHATHRRWRATLTEPADRPRRRCRRITLEVDYRVERGRLRPTVRVSVHRTTAPPSAPIPFLEGLERSIDLTRERGPAFGLRGDIGLMRAVVRLYQAVEDEDPTADDDEPSLVVESVRNPVVAALRHHLVIPPRQGFRAWMATLGRVGRGGVIDRGPVVDGSPADRWRADLRRRALADPAFDLALCADAETACRALGHPLPRDPAGRIDTIVELLFHPWTNVPAGPRTVHLRRRTVRTRRVPLPIHWARSSPAAPATKGDPS